MKSSLTAALVVFGSLAAASAATAATPVVRHPVHRVVVMRAEPTRTVPVRIINETPHKDPGLLGVFQATDGVIYSPVTHDPRSHGLPNY